MDLSSPCSAVFAFDSSRRRALSIRAFAAPLTVVLAFAWGPPAALAQAQATAPEWSGTITANLDVDTTTPDGIHYIRHEVQTWTLIGTKMRMNGAMKLIPATWHYSGNGTRTNPAEQVSQEGTVYRTWSWSIDATAKVDMVFRTANNTHIVGQWSNLATVPNAMTVETMVKVDSVIPLPNKLSTATAEQWAFPRIVDDDDTATTISGSGTFTVPQLGAPIGLSATSPFPATYTWSLTKNTPGVTAPGNTTPGSTTPTATGPTPAAPTDRQVMQPLQSGSATPAAGNAPPAATNRQVGQPNQSGTSPLAPAISTVNPTSGPQWSDALVVTFDAANTHFVQGMTKVDLGAGVTPIAIPPYQAVDIASPTKALINARITGDAAPGPRNVTITTGSEVVKLENGFTVTARDVKEVFPVNPSSGSRGQQNLTVTIARPTSYWSQYFYAGTQLDFGPGIGVASVEAQNGYTVRATLNIAPGASPGPRTVTVKRPGFADEAFAGAFTVTTLSSRPDNQLTPVAVAVFPASLVSVSPASVPRGRYANITVMGKNSHFVQSTTEVSFGAGITADSGAKVTSPTSLTAQVDVSPTASPGSRTVTVKTGTESLTLESALTVTALTVAPNSTPKDHPNLIVTLTGQGTHFVQGTTTVRLGSMSASTQVVVTSPTSLTVQLQIPPNTPTGTYPVTATTGNEIAVSHVEFTYAPVPDSWGKSCATATALGFMASGSTLTRQGTLHAHGVEDWFIVTFAVGADLTLTLRQDQPGGQTNFQMLVVGNSCGSAAVAKTVGESGVNGKKLVLHNVGPHQVLIKVYADTWSLGTPDYTLTFETNDAPPP